MVKTNRWVLALLLLLTAVSGVALACDDAPQYAAADCSGYTAAHAVASCSAPAVAACYAPAEAEPVAAHVHRARWFPGKRIGEGIHARRERRKHRRASRHAETVSYIAFPTCAVVEPVPEPPEPDCGD